MKATIYFEGATKTCRQRENSLMAVVADGVLPQGYLRSEWFDFIWHCEFIAALFLGSAGFVQVC
jgi:hypothetical protein